MELMKPLIALLSIVNPIPILGNPKLR